MRLYRLKNKAEQGVYITAPDALTAEKIFVQHGCVKSIKKILSLSDCTDHYIKSKYEYNLRDILDGEQIGILTLHIPAICNTRNQKSEWVLVPVDLNIE